MGFVDTTIKLLGLSKVIHAWYQSLASADLAARERVARYCEQIAETLARAGAAFAALASDPGAEKPARTVRREFGRLAGYVEDITTALEDHLDGRKLAGVKRRLKSLLDDERLTNAIAGADARSVARLAEAEGYFRALADRLRA